MKRRVPVWGLVATLAIAMAGAAAAQDGRAGDRSGARMGQGYGMSPGAGMGPGYGMGQRRGMGPGYGMGQGMGPGYGMGQGMGPGYGMGQGMGPGYGMGPGRMGGFGPGGMMRGGIGPYEAGVLGLDEGQRRELESIQRENARDHWQLMQELRARRIAMMQLYRDNPAPDPEAVGDAHEAWADAQRRMLEHQARMHNRMREVLTEEQRERLDEMQRFGWGSGIEAE